MGKISLGGLFQQHVMAGHKVAFIGAFDSPRADPSVFWNSILTGKHGSVHIVDIQSQTVKENLGGAAARSKPGSKLARFYDGIKELLLGGVGDPLKHRELLKYSIPGARQSNKLIASMKDFFGQRYELAENMGIRAYAPIKLPKVMIAPAWKTKFADKQLDVLCDVGSFRWIVGSRCAETGESQAHVAKEVIEEYRRISKKAIFVFDPADVDSKLPIEDRLPISLYGARPKVYSNLDIENKYDLADLLPEESRQERFLKHAYNYRKAIVVEW